MSELGTAYIQVVPSAQGISGSISNLFNGEASSAGDEVGGVFGNNLLGAMKGALTGAAVAGAVSALKNTVLNVASAGDEIDKMSQKVGLSAKAYQEWDYVLKISGTEMSSMTTGLKTLTNKLDDAKNGSSSAQEMFAKLGLSMDDLSTMSREDIFGAAIKGFQGMADTTERAALANDLFGRSGQNLTPLFNQSAESTAQLIENFNELGGVMSDDSVKASADLTDAMTTFKSALDGTKNNLIAQFMPAITKSINGLSKVFSEGVDFSALKEKLSKLADMAVKWISDGFPKMLDSGVDMILKFVDGIGKGTPSVMGSIGNVLTKLLTAIINAMPKIVSAGLKLITGLATSFINNLPKIAAVGLQIIVKLASALVANIPKLISKVPSLIRQLVGAFGSIGSSMAGVGKNVVEGLWNGISNMAGWIKSKIQGFGSGVLNSLKSFFGIHSPSTVMRDQVGKYLAQGIGEGFTDEMSGINKDMSNAVNINPMASYTPSGGVVGGNAYGGITLNVYGAQGQNVSELADIVMAKMQSAVDRKNLAWR